MLERPRQRLALGPRRGQCGPSRGQPAFRSVPALGRSGAFLLGLLEPRLGVGRLRRLRALGALQRFAARGLFRRRPSPSASSCASSCCRSCSVRSTCARAASSAASATRRSARIAAWRVKQIGERRLGLARPGFQHRQVRGRSAPTAPRRQQAAARWRPVPPPGPRSAPGGIAAQRFLARDVRRERRVQPVELGQPAHDRVAPRPGRRQLMRQFGRALARLRQLVAPLVEQRCGLVLRLLRIGDRAAAAWRRPPRRPRPRSVAALAARSASTQRAWTSRASAERILSDQLRDSVRRRAPAAASAEARCS